MKKIPDRPDWDAPMLWEVRGEGELLQEVIAQGIGDDMEGYWDDEEECWYLWTHTPGESNYPLHLKCIQDASGVVRILRPKSVRAEHSGYVSVRWCL